MSNQRNGHLTLHFRVLLVEQVRKGEPRLSSGSTVCNLGRNDGEVAAASLQTGSSPPARSILQIAMQCACNRSTGAVSQSGGKELRQSRCAAPLEAEGCRQCSATRTGNQEARWLCPHP